MTATERTESLINALGWEMTIKDVKRLLVRYASPNYKIRAEYVRKCLKEMEATSIDVVIKERVNKDVEDSLKSLIAKKVAKKRTRGPNKKK